MMVASFAGFLSVVNDHIAYTRGAQEKECCLMGSCYIICKYAILIYDGQANEAR